MCLTASLREVFNGLRYIVEPVSIYIVVLGTSYILIVVGG